MGGGQTFVEQNDENHKQGIIKVAIFTKNDKHVGFPFPQKCFGGHLPKCIFAEGRRTGNLSFWGGADFG